MIYLKNISWDTIFDSYIKSIFEDKNGDYAYERDVNVPAILSLCPNDSKNVLDLGCGDGRFTKELSNRFKYVMGVDKSEKMLIHCIKVAPNVEYFKADIEESFPKFSGNFDLITAKLLLMYVNDINFFASECKKILTKNGVLVVSVTHPTKWSKDLKSYFLETKFDGTIANDPKLKVTFFNRTTQTYINTFTKYGFVLEAMLETGVPDAFVLEYPQYLQSQNRPLRLNLKFRNK